MADMAMELVPLRGPLFITDTVGARAFTSLGWLLTSSP